MQQETRKDIGRVRVIAGRMWLVCSLRDLRSAVCRLPREILCTLRATRDPVAAG